VNTTRRIAIVLEAHTARSGDYYDSWKPIASLLDHAGIQSSSYERFYLVDRFADVTMLKWASDDVQAGIKRLADELRRYQPHFVLLLDRSGYLLRAFHGEKRSVDDFRGSVLLASEVLPGVKCMATYSPKRLMLDYGLTGVVRFDLRRCAEEARTDTLDVPEDRIETALSHADLIARLRDIYDNDRHVATDIEGYPDRISCIGFATSARDAFVVPFTHTDGTSWWSEDEEIELWGWVKRVLEKPTVLKDCHNALYELFCLAWSYGIVIEGLEHDTMVLWFELYAEMEKSLGFVASILTRHPWYKHERGHNDDTTQLRYNGKDCCRTFEIRERMVPMLKPQQAAHYRFNMNLLVPLAYMSLRGIRYDKAEAQRRLEATQQTIYALQDEINQEAAKSADRPKLRQFYEALGPVGGAGAARLPAGEEGRGSDGGAAVGGNVTVGGGCEAPRRAETEVSQDCQSHCAADAAKGESGTDCRLAALIPLLVEAFCQARRTEKREVEEISWQPMLWNGKRWVRKGSTCVLKGKRSQAQKVTKSSAAVMKPSGSPSSNSSHATSRLRSRILKMCGDLHWIVKQTSVSKQLASCEVLLRTVAYALRNAANSLPS
jgi:hypothetical protein